MKSLVTLSRAFVEFGPFTKAEVLDFSKHRLQARAEAQSRQSRRSESRPRCQKDEKGRVMRLRTAAGLSGARMP
jgi:hypothetical protein